ncbi:MAG: TetR-like C-terminal domain-containing protein [Vicinamibacteraceae bacterium]
MFGGFVDAPGGDGELAAEATGAFQALVDALTTLRREGLVRGDDTVMMARFVWAVVHGVAMLGIDRGVREPCDVDDLTRYAIERLRTGIGADMNQRRVAAGHSRQSRLTSTERSATLSKSAPGRPRVRAKD